MSLTFYYSPHSSASPVHWTLNELGIPYEKVLIDIKAGDNVVIPPNVERSRSNRTEKCR